MTKLRDFQPHWVNIPQAADGVKIYIGVSFLCPHCTHTPCPTCGAQRGRRLAVSFWPPIIPADCGLDQSLALQCAEQIPHDSFHVRVSGETFDDLTINPSIGFERDGHWHGRITHGEMQ
jgi:hypothetical protein